MPQKSKKPTITALLTTEYVAGIFQVKEITVREWLRLGKMKGTKIGKAWRITQAAVDEFVGQ